MSPVAASVVETFVTLLAVAALAVLVLVGARKLGVGRPSGPLELLGRLPLDARRAVYLVRVGDRAYVVGASEAGLARLGEVPAESVAADDGPAAPARARFADVLARARAPRAPEPMSGPDA